MSATRSDFSMKSDETVLGFALAEFELLQPLTAMPYFVHKDRQKQHKMKISIELLLFVLDRNILGTMRCTLQISFLL